MKAYIEILDELQKEIELNCQIEEMNMDDMLQRFEQFDLDGEYLLEILEKVQSDSNVSFDERRLIHERAKFILHEYLRGIVSDEIVLKLEAILI